MRREATPAALAQAKVGFTLGIKIANKRDFVCERFGMPAWQALLATLSEGDRTRIEAVDPAAWYETGLHERLLNALCQQLHADDALLLTMGRADADRELSTVFRWFLRLMRPSFAIRNMNLYWRRAHDTGHWNSRQEGTQVTAELRDWALVHRAACITVLGNMGRVMELFGARVGLLEHPECRAEGAPLCIFRAHLELASDEPRTGARPTRADLSAVARELTQYRDRAALAEALARLVRSMLSCPRMELWATGPNGRMQLLCLSGDRGAGDTRHFVLEVAGQSVGRLEVELPDGNSGRGVDELLRELVPWIAVSLQMTRSETDAAEGNGESELARRLRRAREACQLTRRQVEVLELVVSGKTNKEIALTLGLSEGTVEVHVTNLLRKLGTSNRAGLVALFWGEL
ncbi:helix-turn-helix domain-containing protein [Hyalangium rubrum]|uniref:Helix-turn-helix transcriptional regulator n=1 Tax=Hyalangium rubrum TaxID=3103134 RepID=A0ABU5GYL5_9BACT|nr:helix-turn-helix transcriptional regulator [Hyalangium sp. s54d21]MDY7226278.1 helix-turn-helix transcriptional regulator [Hyalangium sp. s54d21]